ncbi:cbb3-type cytochrome c oxidase N-terminal domain-containing protein [Taibaiella helva]|uniref:cbb3-type cytochrome c oxidase N-terminal domain-containing protein n=1 Tax=Taibaiella helva TaxID=2301235 RepID=UPI000E58684D|nr:cbb3-type cytochrome c oxidase N-terminal domain-containing protein [Taibaiella helva]
MMFFENTSLKAMPVLLFSLLATGMPLISVAGEKNAAASSVPVGDGYDMVRYTLAGMLVLMLCVIAILGNAVSSAAKLYWERKEKERQRPPSATTTALLVLILLSGIVLPAHAQEAKEAVKVPGSSLPVDITVLLIIVSLEFAVILVLAKMLLQFLNTREQEVRTVKKLRFKRLFQKLNQTVPVEEEHILDLHHDYDGIRELDNKIPAWWRYAFYGTILFSAVYLYRMFVSEALPDQLQELAVANKEAAIQKAEYLKNAANNVDENNVVMMGASAIAEGQSLFVRNCLACHGDKGQGGVGPNLTDDYWLHKGGLKNIFYSIKYGWPEKGMKSWKEDFSPVQIAQLASFVRSIQGTSPAGGKEPQGELYKDDAVVPVTPAAGAAATTNLN